MQIDDFALYTRTGHPQFWFFTRGPGEFSRDEFPKQSRHEKVRVHSKKYVLQQAIHCKKPDLICADSHFRHVCFFPHFVCRTGTRVRRNFKMSSTMKACKKMVALGSGFPSKKGPKSYYLFQVRGFMLTIWFNLFF